MSRWLLKTEPSDYSFARLQAEGRTVWDGVKNPLARKHLRAIRKGDEILVYHTGSEKSVVGLARARADAREDTVEIEAVRPLGCAVSLAALKGDGRCRGFDLIRLPRLSVMPVPDGAWKAVLELANS